jgi:hypothetical protein
MIPRITLLSCVALVLLGNASALGPTNVSAADIESHGSASTGEDWPRWRGPRGDGTWHGPKLSEHWPAELKVRWRKPVGGGYAGVIVAGERVLLADRQTVPFETECVVCFDAKTGDVRWTHSDSVHYDHIDYGNGPRAAPAVFEGLVYSLGATGKMNCLDLETGTVRWSANLVSDFPVRRKGRASWRSIAAREKRSGRASRTRRPTRRRS